MKRFDFKIIYIILFITLHMPLKTMAQITTSVSEKNKSIIIASKTKQYHFTGEFSILYSTVSPDLALRSAGITGVLYNVPTWKVTDKAKADLKESTRGDDMFGDGFDDNILKANQNERTPNLFNSGNVIYNKSFEDH